jgi:hypothetical protein
VSTYNPFWEKKEEKKKIGGCQYILRDDVEQTGLCSHVSGLNKPLKQKKKKKKKRKKKKEKKK